MSRCLNLAIGLRQFGVETHFIVRDHPGAFYAPLRSFKVTVLPSSFASSPRNLPSEKWNGVSDQQEALEILNLVTETNADLIILDHYAIGLEVEKLLKEYSVLVVDDLAREHCARWVLDHNYGADKRYSRMNHQVGKYLLGPDFALLGENFEKTRPKELTPPNTYAKVGVFFGGSDPTNETLKVMHALDSNLWSAEIILTDAHPTRPEVERMAGGAGWRIHSRVDDMASFIARQDVFFGASGVSALERCCLGVPSLCAVIAENQLEIAQSLSDTGAMIYVGDGRHTTAYDWKSAIEDVRKDPERLRSVANVAFGICDGRGVGRVCREVLG
jgi:UDP-2,4-diacetamido-2,4,6-trideoxy-beta-L-altropyranose hydrolase